MDDQKRWDEPQQQQQMILQKEASGGSNNNNTTDQSDHHRQSAAGTSGKDWRKFDVRYSTFVEASKQVNLAKEFEQYGETLQQYERNTLHKPTVTAEREMTTLRTSFGRIQAAAAEQLKESESFEAIFASVQAMGEFLRSRPYLTREDLEYHRLQFLETYNRLMVALVRTTVSCSLMLAIEQVHKLAAFLGEVVGCGSVLGSCRAQFDEVMALVRQAKDYCSKADQYLEEYHSGVGNIGERRRRELARLIRMQRDLITMTYSQAVEKMGR